jgi:hypothetical protein
VEELTRKMIETIRDAAKELKGAKRRAFEAQVCLDYLGGDPRLTETVFGWSRHTVAKGLEELRTGRIIPDAPRTYKPKTPTLNSPRILSIWSIRILRPIPSFKDSSSTPGSPPRRCVPC